jgi:hypothetical protein
MQGTHQDQLANALRQRRRAFLIWMRHAIDPFSILGGQKDIAWDNVRRAQRRVLRARRAIERHFRWEAANMKVDVRDIWFRTGLPLPDIARRIRLESDFFEDGEDYWNWVIGRLGDVELDITRTHTQPPELVETRIFEVGHGILPESLVLEIVERLRPFVSSPIYSGRWCPSPESDGEFEAVREFKLTSHEI